MPLEDYDDYWEGHPTSCEVFEEEDDEDTIVSSLVGPNGETIKYRSPSSKQGYIGFIHPDYHDAVRARSRRKRPKATAKRSKTNASSIKS